jgi:hypothetical protein
MEPDHRWERRDAKLAAQKKEEEEAAQHEEEETPAEDEKKEDGGEEGGKEEGGEESKDKSDDDVFNLPFVAVSDVVKDKKSEAGTIEKKQGGVSNAPSTIPPFHLVVVVNWGS